VASVPVSVTPTDLLGQKTALFGMTRTGKSNTTKIILKAIFELRWAAADAQRIGHLYSIRMVNTRMKTRKTQTRRAIIPMR